MYRRTHSYDPEKVVITVNGVYLTGFSDKGKVEVERNEDSHFPKVGVDGGVHYAENNNITGKAKVTLMSTSPSVSFLRNMDRLKEEFTLTITDLNDVSENIASDGCRILKLPKYSAMKDVEEVEVEFFIPFLD